MIFKKNKYLDLAARILIVIAGACVAAFGNKWFLVPYNITPGGFTGFATILHKTFLSVVPIGVITIILNVPLYIIALKIIGNAFGLLSVIGTVSYSVCIDVIPTVNFGVEPILACVYGGAILGVSFGAILRVGGSTGGSDMLSYLINHYKPNLSIGVLLLIIDGAVITTSGIIFGIEKAMYAFIMIFLSTKVVDYIMDGGKMSKAYYIISNKADEVAKVLLEKMDRGVTGLKGKGMYTKRDKDILLCIVLRSQGPALRDLVHSIDERAFIFATNIQEVYGEGFYQLRKKKLKQKNIFIGGKDSNEDKYADTVDLMNNINQIADMGLMETADIKTADMIEINDNIKAEAAGTALLTDNIDTAAARATKDDKTP